MWLQKLTNRKTNILKLLTGAGVAVALAWPVAVRAQAVTQAYGTTGNIQKGMIVSLDPKDTNDVEPLSSLRAKEMLGVAVAAGDSTVSLSGDAGSSPTYVATTGTYDVLVSTQNGPIKSGDFISISGLDGIGMKADSHEPVVLGKALQSFDGRTAGTSSAVLKTPGGNVPVTIGSVAVGINIALNPLAPVGTADGIPTFLEKLTAAIAGKQVSAARIYMSLAILLAAVLITVSLLYSGVRSSLVAVGRNPLARGSVLRGMAQVIVVGLLIFAAGLAVIYMLLRL